jgi:hypothetical protein
MDSSVFDFKNCFRWVSLFVTDLNTVQTLNPDFVHFAIDRVPTVSGKAVNTRTNEKVGFEFLCGTEKLVNITLAIADVNASAWLIE